CQHTYGAPPTF
nr:immunoglobulin light chain junction region [Macaca mulatta]